MDQTPNEATHLIERLRAGDRQALGELFDRYRDRLRRMVELPHGPAAAGPPRRLGRPPGGVPRRWPATSTPTCADPKLPPLLWMRLHVGRRLTTLHRQHLGTRMRDAGLEISLYREALPEASSAALASMLLGRHTSPTQAAQRAERLLRVQEALEYARPDRPRGAGPAALRAAQPRRGGPGARDQSRRPGPSGISAP